MSRKMLIIAIAAAAATLLILVFILNAKKKTDSFGDGAAKEGISLSNLTAQAKGFEAGSDFVSAKNTYQELINSFPNSGKVMEWQKKIESINMRLLFSQEPAFESVVYEIKPGDTLGRIARSFNTTVELIRKSNNLSGDKIVPGKKLKVRNAPFNILVDKSQNILTLKSGEEIIKTYTVSTGKNNCTPAGAFKIAEKLVDPVWFRAGAVVPAGSPENILGTRWLGLDLDEYGIHGTTEPESLGSQVTQGCVRMANSDVEELFMIVPVGTEVTIVD